MRTFIFCFVVVFMLILSADIQTSDRQPKTQQPPANLDKWVKDLSSEDQETLYTAAFSLAQSGSTAALEPLLSLLKNTKYQGPFDCAAMSLAHLRKKEAIPSLVNLLKDERWYMRKQAAWVLGRLGDKKTEDVLISLLRDESPSVRMYAVWALGRIQSRKAYAQLEQIAKHDKEKAIQREVGTALECIRSRIQLRTKSPLPPWILIAGQDIPISDIRGIRMEIEGKHDHLWGFNVESEEGHNLEVTPFSCSLIVHKGRGMITCSLPLDQNRSVRISVE